MNGPLKNMAAAGLTALTLGATALATTSPADAQRFHGGYGYHHHGLGRGAAIGLGVAGAALATGAAYNYYHRPYGYSYGYDRPYGTNGYRPYGY